MTREELLKEAIRRFRVIAEDARKISLGNISHSTPKQIERYAVNSFELLETHICDKENNLVDVDEFLKKARIYLINKGIVHSSTEFDEFDKTMKGE